MVDINIDCILLSTHKFILHCITEQVMDNINNNRDTWLDNRETCRFYITLSNLFALKIPNPDDFLNTLEHKITKRLHENDELETIDDNDLPQIINSSEICIDNDEKNVFISLDYWVS